METSRDERLEQAIAAVDGLMAQARAAGSQSVMFLEMAKLQLQLEFNEITDDEFGAFCDALEGGHFVNKGDERPAVTHARARRNGEMRVMRRAWRQPQEPVRQRGVRAGR
jgi:hypothetical protein